MLFELNSKSSIPPYFFTLALVLVTFVNYAQNVVLSPTIVDKKVEVKDTNHPELIGKRNTGIMIKETTNGIVFKSHLFTFPQIVITLYDPNRKLIFSSKGELKQHTDYRISTDGLPSGQYILNFEYMEILVVCNVQI